MHYKIGRVITLIKKVGQFMIESSKNGEVMHIAYCQSGVGHEVARRAIDKKVYGLLGDPSLGGSNWQSNYINEGELRYPVIPYRNPRKIPIEEIIHSLGNP